MHVQNRVNHQRGSLATSVNPEEEFSKGCLHLSSHHQEEYQKCSTYREKLESVAQMVQWWPRARSLAILNKKTQAANRKSWDNGLKFKLLTTEESLNCEPRDRSIAIAGCLLEKQNFVCQATLTDSQYLAVESGNLCCKSFQLILLHSTCWKSATDQFVLCPQWWWRPSKEEKWYQDNLVLSSLFCVFPLKLLAPTGWDLSRSCGCPPVLQSSFWKLRVGPVWKKAVGYVCKKEFVLRCMLYRKALKLTRTHTSIGLMVESIKLIRMFLMIKKTSLHCLKSIHLSGFVSKFRFL